MYKRFFEQRITCYNKQWYCYPCKTTLQNLTMAQQHSENAHSTTSTQTFNFPNKSVTLNKNGHKTFVKHSIVIRDVQQDYFCMNCQCSISFHNIHCHLNGKDHQKCMNKLKCSTNEQNSSNANNKQSNVSVNEKNSTERINELNLSSVIKPIYKLKSTSNSSTQMANGTIAGVPYALLQEVKMYKHFSMQNSVYYGQRYCHLDRSMFHSLTDLKCHLQEVYLDVDTQVLDFRDKFIRSSDKIYQELLNHDKIMKDTPQDCLLCQCSIPFLDHFYEHSIGNKCTIESNEKYIDTSVVPETPANEQRNVNNDKADEQNVSISTFDRNDSIKDLLSNFKTEERSMALFKYSCDQCNKIIEGDDVVNHEITVHKSDMMSSMRYINDCLPVIKDFNIAIHYPLFRCSCCNEVIHGVLSLASHLSKHKHEENVKVLIGTKEREYDTRAQTCFEPCELLSVISFRNNDGTVQIKEQPVIYIRNSFEKRFIYVCFACPYVDRLIEHLCKTEHLKYFKNILLTYNYMHDMLVSKERSANGIREMTLAFKDVSLKKREINGVARVNAEQRDHNLIANVSNENDGRDEESNSGLFISLDIFADINNSLYQRVDSVLAQPRVESNKKSALDRYNNIYSGEFLDFEKIMFTCSERKLDEMKLHLQFFLSHCGNMVCLVCDDSQPSDAQTVYEHINCKEHVTRFKMLQENKEHVELLKELIKPAHFQQAKCYACNKIFYGKHNRNEPKRVDFKYHARSLTHKHSRKQLLSLTESILEEFQNLCYNIQYFACVRCNVRFKQKIKFLEHLKAKHRAVLIKKDNSMFDFCLTCATLWYEDECYARESCTNYQRHCWRLTHQYLQKTNDFTVTSLPQSLQELLKNVNGTAGNLFNLSNDVLNDRKVIQVTDALKHIFETYRLPVEVYTFGSRVTGLALPNSDIDIYLNFGNEYTEPEMIKSRSKQIQNCLRADQENWNVELILNSSRTPIIKVKHRLTGLQCDISFMNGLAVENSKLIRSFNRAYPQCKKLTLFLKKWLSQGDLTGSEGITNYALVWLVIFYLQVKFEAAIPSIAALIKSHNQSKIVSGWETGVGDIILINAPKLPINELLLGFFEYYRSFDYMQFVICPLLGETYQKRAFAEISTLPNSMALYITQLRNKNPEYFRTDSPMCVQDPFDLSHNLTKAVSILTLKRFKYYCNESSRVLRYITTSSKKRHIKLF